jgi:hypothetical protein
MRSIWWAVSRSAPARSVLRIHGFSFGSEEPVHHDRSGLDDRLELVPVDQLRDRSARVTDEA